MINELKTHHLKGKKGFMKNDAERLFDIIPTSKKRSSMVMENHEVWGWWLAVAGPWSIMGPAGMLGLAAMTDSSAVAPRQPWVANFRRSWQLGMLRHQNWSLFRELGCVYFSGMFLQGVGEVLAHIVGGLSGRFLVLVWGCWEVVRSF